MCEGGVKGRNEAVKLSLGDMRKTGSDVERNPCMFIITEVQLTF